MSEAVGWPTREQELVLRAAVLDAEPALAAWRELVRTVKVDDLDYSAHRVLPLVFRNFERQGIDVPDRQRLKHVYRRMWANNQIVLNSGRVAVRTLNTAGIDTLLLKGAALVALDYGDVGVRPMGDLDILVRPPMVASAGEVLSEQGWRSRGASSPARLGYLHADELRSAQGVGLDLHWRTFMSPEPEEGLWEHAVPAEIGGVPTRALEPADRLLHVCVHGLGPNSPRAIRWVADSYAILARHEVDWDRVVDQARRRQLSFTMGRALAYLVDTVDAPVPGEVVAALRRGPHSRVEVAEHDSALRTVTLREAVRWHWWRYHRLEPCRMRALAGFPRYLRLLLGYDRWRDFARHVARRLTRPPR